MIKLYWLVWELEIFIRVEIVVGVVLGVRGVDNIIPSYVTGF